jgi:hypothetical protein
MEMTIKLWKEGESWLCREFRYGSVHNGELILCGEAVDAYFNIPKSRGEAWAHFTDAEKRPSNAYLKLKASKGGVKVEGHLRSYHWHATYTALDRVLMDMDKQTCWLAIEYRK